MGKRPMDERFAKFGTVSFTAVSRVNDFIDHLEQGRVMGTRCKNCGALHFPPRADCCRCMTSEMDWFEVTGAGRLVTWSKLKYAPVGFGDDLPYCIAVLDYGDYKVFGRIAGSLSEEELDTGMELRTVVNRLANGRLNYVFETVPPSVAR